MTRLNHSRAAHGTAGRRKAELGVIHQGKKALGWSDETYRDVLHQLTGRTSAADLDDAGRALVMDRMRDLGFARTGRSAEWDGARAAGDDVPPQVLKARALWDQLAAAGALRDASAAALQAFAERQTGKSRLEWCTPKELNSVVEGLKAWLARARAAGRKP
jgi:phage gp16-like protein